MGGMLSQDEINALLSGMDLSDEGDQNVAGVSGGSQGGKVSALKIEDLLTETEKDAIGEVANISMGSCKQESQHYHACGGSCHMGNPLWGIRETLCVYPD